MTMSYFFPVLPALISTTEQRTEIEAPLRHLPRHITAITAFGERAMWSPDGTRIAFMRGKVTPAPLANRARIKICKGCRPVPC